MRETVEQIALLRFAKSAVITRAVRCTSTSVAANSTMVSSAAARTEADSTMTIGHHVPCHGEGAVAGLGVHELRGRRSR